MQDLLKLFQTGRSHSEHSMSFAVTTLSSKTFIILILLLPSADCSALACSGSAHQATASAVPSRL